MRPRRDDDGDYQCQANQPEVSHNLSPSSPCQYFMTTSLPSVIGTRGHRAGKSQLRWTSRGQVRAKVFSRSSLSLKLQCMPHKTSGFAIVIGVFLFAGFRQTSAHHGTSTYDMNVEIRLTGTVKEWTFGNPHTWLWLTVPRSDAPIEEWSIESAPPNYLTGQGWSPSTLKAGEKLTAVISPLKGEPKRGILLEVQRSDGKTLVVRPRGSFGRPARVGQ